MMGICGIGAGRGSRVLRVGFLGLRSVVRIGLCFCQVGLALELGSKEIYAKSTSTKLNSSAWDEGRVALR